MNYSDRIILALDSNKIENNLSLIKELVPPIKILKIGPVAFLPNSNELIEAIKKTNSSVMFDFKFFDIPNTIIESLKFLFEINTKIFTMHCLAGPKAISSVVSKINDLNNEIIHELDLDKNSHKNYKGKPDIFGVTILTSFDNAELVSIGLKGTVEDNVLRLAESAIKAGIDGVVCSGQEVESIRRNFGDKVKILVPGVRLDSSDDDQKRIITPKEAFSLGADYIVLGRTLTSYEDKKMRYDNIIKSLD
ncbi:orotidine-5'-phosphate decarboxylase [bacterium]|nr:orotidine-5'-phosphate decarboxylase [bacterium]MBT3795026.1 orotidine-5'-phosphate decarboxylase [bacterium]MBT4634649.1 orotidine-5'-phosphate decarboxylase [bacterium]